MNLEQAIQLMRQGAVISRPSLGRNRLYMTQGYTIQMEDMNNFKAYPPLLRNSLVNAFEADKSHPYFDDIDPERMNHLFVSGEVMIINSSNYTESYKFTPGDFAANDFYLVEMIDFEPNQLLKKD